VKERSADPAGFSLIEVIVAMFILGIIAVALLPALWQGLRFSVEQSDVATATRHLNSLVEQARKSQDCAATDENGLLTFPATASVPSTYTDPRGHLVTTTAQAGYACSPGAITYVKLSATDAGGKLLATVTAKILMKP